MNREDVLTSCRMSGIVKRYHAWPTLREQTVADHTWNVLRIWSQIWGPMSLTPAVTTTILWHDAEEIVTGDPPFPFKSNNPEIKRHYDQAAGLIRAEMSDHALPILCEEERVKMKICDLLDMHEFGLIEWQMGNCFAEPIIKDTRDAILGLLHSLESKDNELVLDYLQAKCGRWYRKKGAL